ncbi:helix-turn-helix transcriptional regulator [Microbacterium enclense]|uniref:helix-turn-helix transcriptional regulator n=1 Tax=Microbacterium enclense TaxID=993073 RepID=UPI003D70D133
MIRTAFGDLPEYLTRKELASLTGISVATFARWAVEKNPDGPRMTKFSGTLVRYARTDVIAWLESRKVSA